MVLQVAEASSPQASKVEDAIEFAHQAERLGQYTHAQEKEVKAEIGSTQAVEARFITGQDPVIETANGGRLPAVPVEEAKKLNWHKDVVEGRDPKSSRPSKFTIRKALDGSIHGVKPVSRSTSQQSGEPGAPLREAIPPWRTNPLFPPLPMYGPPTLMRDMQVWSFRISSAILSFLFLLVIVLGASFTSIPVLLRRLAIRLTGRDPNCNRQFYDEEMKRQEERQKAAVEWEKKSADDSERETTEDEYAPTEGGKDPLVCDIGYYARRVGLDAEVFEVQTEDGYIIELWHLYNPKERPKATDKQRAPHSPEVFPESQNTEKLHDGSSADVQNKRYPVLLIHGLLQSAGAYCCTDDNSLAFYLAKSGYDVWLGNNRCGFQPKHTMLTYNDPRMWAWNIRQMGVMDLPAFISRVLSETGFPKLGLIAHSQGTTETLVALAKEQRPEIGEKISVFCALAPAAYAGPLIGKAYFKFMRNISPGMFRAVFGIHAFIPLMMVAHKVLPGPMYGAMGYLVFSFLFDWSDERWERDIRDRMFQFSPVYVSAESMRWWLGRECFAKQKCILATREEKNIEDQEDAAEEAYFNEDTGRSNPHPSEEPARSDDSGSSSDEDDSSDGKRNAPKDHFDLIPSKKHEDRAQYAWYAPPVPPMAMWIAGNDNLVDGRRLLRRFDRGREPYVKMVHTKIIEGYEHLDVIWAMDSIQKVGSEVKEVIWKTVAEGPGGRAWCRTPTGCEGIGVWESSTEGGKRGVDSTAGEWKGDPEKGAEGKTRLG